jgi:uncharacterized phage protein (TIGR01671 family)
MRELKFRGKRISGGEWVEGDLTQYSEAMSYITVDLVENEVHQVHTSTVGQYTGLKDKNGKEIYEGDVIEFEYYIDGVKFKEIGVVEWLNGTMAVKCDAFCSPNYMRALHEMAGYKVIGNIYENPELLEGME